MNVQCKDCHNWSLLDEMWEAYGCPVCRAARVAKAFKPVDVLRTALGVLNTGIDWQSAEWKGVKARADEAMRMHSDGTWHVSDAEQDAEVPRGCKMPKMAEEQVYQLRRMFRL